MTGCFTPGAPISKSAWLRVKKRSRFGNQRSQDEHKVQGEHKVQDEHKVRPYFISTGRHKFAEFFATRPQIRQIYFGSFASFATVSILRLRTSSHRWFSCPGWDSFWSSSSMGCSLGDFGILFLLNSILRPQVLYARFREPSKGIKDRNKNPGNIPWVRLLKVFAITLHFVSVQKVFSQVQDPADDISRLPGH